MSDEPILVQGSWATIPEAKISAALDTLGLKYIFQYELWGGQFLRGGVVIDWLVMTIPLSQPLEYDGGRWHTGAAKSEDVLQRRRIANHFGVPEVKVITEDEVDSDTPQEQVVAVVRKKLHG
jgi:hypothetical protein